MNIKIFEFLNFNFEARIKKALLIFFRRSVSYQTAPCALRIERAHPDDSAVGNSGEWECHLQTDDSVNGLITTMG